MRLHVAPNDTRDAVSACLSRGRYDSGVVAKRRDGEGRRNRSNLGKPRRPADREAMGDGAFDELPDQGADPLDDDPASGGARLRLQVLRNAGVAPPWIQAYKEVPQLLDGGMCCWRGRRPRVVALARARAHQEVRAGRRGGKPCDRAANRGGADGWPAPAAARSKAELEQADWRRRSAPEHRRRASAPMRVTAKELRRRWPFLWWGRAYSTDFGRFGPVSPWGSPWMAVTCTACDAAQIGAASGRRRLTGDLARGRRQNDRGDLAGPSSTRIGSECSPSHPARRSGLPSSTSLEIVAGRGFSVPGSRTPSPHSMKNGRHGSAIASSTPALRQRNSSPDGVTRDPPRTVRPSRPAISSSPEVRTAQPISRPESVAPSPTQRPNTLPAATR